MLNVRAGSVVPISPAVVYIICSKITGHFVVTSSLHSSLIFHETKVCVTKTYTCDVTNLSRSLSTSFPGSSRGRERTLGTRLNCCLFYRCHIKWLHKKPKQVHCIHQIIFQHVASWNSLTFSGIPNHKHNIDYKPSIKFRSD